MADISFENLGDLSADDLATLATTAREAFDALDLDNPSDDDLVEGERLSAGLDAIVAQTTANEEAATERANRAAALKSKFGADLDEETDEEKAAREQAEADAAAEAEAKEKADAEAAAQAEADEAAKVEADEAAKVAAAAKTKTAAALARRTARPSVPASGTIPVSITAAADVPNFATGSALSDMTEVGKALVSRMSAFGTPSGDGTTENLQHYGVAKFKMDFPDELTIKPHGDDMEVLTHAAREDRLKDNSLVAAGGWCAPSETLYDLCVTETLDGILSVPEVNVSRGGIRFTKGPQFADLYSDIGFLQTEAQAIAGTTKTCYEVECPSFTEVRLDAVGVCIKAPILTNAAYPELVNRVLSGAMVVHAHRVNASVIGRMVTAAGAALVANDFGGSTASTMAAIDLVGDQLRQKYKMGFNDTMEVVLPFWTKNVIRNDLALRGGRDIAAITDQAITAEFAARRMSPQFVYDWQEMDLTDDGWPATFQVLMYPAGTFVKGVSDVITLNAVYDAASLATNVYTALFFEQGLLVANMCNEARLITIPVCAAGRTGIVNVAECGVTTA